MKVNVMQKEARKQAKTMNWERHIVSVSSPFSGNRAEKHLAWFWANRKTQLLYTFDSQTNNEIQKASNNDNGTKQAYTNIAFNI